MSANQSTLLRIDVDSLDFLKNPDTRQVLINAANTFIKHEDGTTKIWAASRDWFLEEWGRDTFISLPGLLLTTGNFDDVKLIFERYANYEQNGLIPNIIRPDMVQYNTADASLWFIHALKSYVEASKDWKFVEKLLPSLHSIITNYRNGTHYERSSKNYSIAMDENDGLIMSPAQASWMDADPSGSGDNIITPRDGKCVEINALWYAALRFVASVEDELNNKEYSAELNQLADIIRESFRNKFWNSTSNCLFDVIEGDPHGDTIRPNQIIAISHGGDLLDNSQKKQVLEIIERELLTPGGLRTLSPSDPKYIGEYDTFAPMAVKDLAYHQGTVWPWLIGPYCDAVRIVRAEQGSSDEEINREVDGLIVPLVQFCLDSEFKSLPEVFSGDAPYYPGGTTSQAWSVAEVFRQLDTI